MMAHCSMAFCGCTSGNNSGWELVCPYKITGASMADSHDAYIVGQQGAVYGYDGVDWTKRGGGLKSDYSDVWVFDREHVWITEKYSKGIVAEGSVVFFNGKEFSRVLNISGFRMYGISGTDTSSIWAVGDAGKIFFFNGTDWREQDSGVSWNIKDIWAHDANHVWAVGSGGILFFDGDKWTCQWKRETAGIFEGLNAIDGFDQNNVWAAGSIDGSLKGSILFFDGKEWVPQFRGERVTSEEKARLFINGHDNEPLREPYASVHASSRDNVYVSSEIGLYRYDGNDWKRVYTERDGIAITIVFGSGSTVMTVGSELDYDTYFNTMTFYTWIGNLESIMSGRCCEPDNFFSHLISAHTRR